MARRSPSPASKAEALPTDGLDPLRLIAHLPIRPYHNILNVRCGSGYFTIPLAKSLFDGKVYALDSTGAHLDELKQKLLQTRLGNVEVITTKKQQQAIPAKSLDGVLMPFILYQTDDKEAFLKEILKPLKQGAWVAVLEWQQKATTEGPPLDQRLSDAEAVALGERVGLRFTSKRVMSNRHYLVLLRK